MPRPSDVAVGTAILILNQQNQILLGKRKSAHAAGCWSFPGGWMDRTDTSSEDTVIREAWEETGILVASCCRLSWTTEDHEDLACRTVTLYHLARSYQWQGTPVVMEPNKCEEWRWFDMDKLPSPLFPRLAAVVADLRNADNG